MRHDSIPKSRELALKFFGRRPPLSVVPRELEVDRGRKGLRIRRHCRDKMSRLRLAGRAEREKMISAANNSSGVTAPPVFGERRVRKIRAFCCFDIGKLNSGPLDRAPINRALVMRNIDAADRISRSRGRVRNPDPKKAERQTDDH
jgi:hypothetical protein